MDKETKNVKIQFPSGNEYKGEWTNGQPNGYGEMLFANQDRYEGGWKDGKMDGQGKYHVYDVNCDAYVANYEGDFVGGKRCGVGCMVYADRSTYKGQWQNDQRFGDGFAVFASGNCFHGLWQHDKMLRGVYCLTSGDKYDGELAEGKFEGYGKYFWADGKWYEGLWQQGMMDKGMMFFPDGRFLEIENGKEL